MSAWTDEQVAELRRRWKAGETGGMIGRALGMSRSAVIGKLNRLGLIGDLPSPEKKRRLKLGYEEMPEDRKIEWAAKRRAWWATMGPRTKEKFLAPMRAARWPQKRRAA